MIDNWKKIKQQHLNKGKLHLNQNEDLGGRLSDIYLRVISKILKCISQKSPISINETVDCKSILKAIRGDNKRKLIFAHLNINSIRNKFLFLAEETADNIDVLMISKTEIDETI